MLTRNIFPFLITCFFAVSALAETRLDVQIDRSIIYEGESFLYQFVISDASPISANLIPDTSAWTDFDVVLLGRQTEQRGGASFTMIVNGQTIRDDRTAITYRTQFNYALIPKRTGSMTIPLPRVVLDGKTLLPQSFSVAEGTRHVLADHSVAVQVLGVEEQEIVFMSIETSRSRLYPLQPLEVTLVIQIKGLPGRYAGTDPLMVPQQLWQPPHLRIPWAEENPKGFQSDQSLNHWLRSFLVNHSLGRTRQGGFAINDYAGGGNLFNFSTVPQQFTSFPRKIRRTDAQGNEAIYWEYRFPRTFLPQEFGNYTFGPVTLKGTLPIADAEDSSRVAWKRIYAIARPVAVAVVDVPQENRPADYIGAFGSFHWEVNLTPHQARVGDPMTLTLRLAGEGSMANVRPIDVSANPDIFANFRVHMPPTEEIREHSCTFIYTIRPQQSGAISFPPISISVFDVKTERFVQLESPPILLDIADSESVQSATLFGNIPSGTGETQRAEGGLFANKMKPTEILPPITFVQWAAAISLLAGGYVMIALCVLLWRSPWTNLQQQRRRGALKRAKQRLSNILIALNTGNLVEMSDELQSTISGYIADRLDIVEQGMTTSDACQLLLDNRIPESLVHAIRAILESFDAVKYGGMDIRSLDEKTHTVATLLQQLENL
jgi:hypothetical protein